MLKAFDEIESSHKADLYPQQNLSFMLAQNFLSLSFNSHAFAQYISVQMVLFFRQIHKFDTYESPNNEEDVKYEPQAARFT